MRLLVRACAKTIPLADQSVQCCVTSPPYWGLRDYGTGEWVGGDSLCDHAPKLKPRCERPASGLTGGTATVDAGTIMRDRCHCGATRKDRQLGLETTPEEYVANMVAVFREVRRVLRDDGTLWLNLGDSYAAGGHGGGGSYMAERKDAAWQRESTATGWRSPFPCLKPKDLVGIPWRVAFALQADGWYLRSDIIWAKPNPMPESVRDRPTKAHEYLFLLTKSRSYYYDAEAIKEAATLGAHTRDRASNFKKVGQAEGADNGRRAGHTARGAAVIEYDGTRNKRTVWTVATQPYSGAHFATFPPKLIEPCILAGCPSGGIVLDPFVGSGTTITVANEHGRKGVGLDINPAYFALSKARTNQTQARFA